MSKSKKQPPRKSERRSPRQSRSRELVRAVREAGRILLAESGPESLTTSRIAERAGVSVGSLYQYFENKDAILEAIYDAIDEEARGSIPEFVSKLREISPRDRLRLGTQYAIERHRKMLEIDADYYREHHTRYRISPAMAEESADMGGQALALARHFLEEDGTAERAGLHLDHAAFLMGRGISAILRAAIEESPQRLDDPSFLDELIKMMERYLFSSPEKTQQPPAGDEQRASGEGESEGKAEDESPS